MNKFAVVALFVGASVAAVAAGKPEMVKVGSVGKLAIVNSCGADGMALQIASDKLGNLLMIQTEVQNGGWTFSGAVGALVKTGANAAVFVVKDKALPMSLVALEQKWGVVNVEGMDATCVEKEILRVATILLGGAYSKYEASTMRPVFSIDELKTKAGDSMTFDSIMGIYSSLEALGFKQYQLMTREEAIGEGYPEK